MLGKLRIGPAAPFNFVQQHLRANVTGVLRGRTAYSRPSPRKMATATEALPTSSLAPVSSGSIKSELHGLLKTALSTAYPQEDEEPVLAPCNNPKFGDYQCNNAMPLFAKLKGKEGAPKAPRDIATALVKALPASDLIESTSLAGPGFINIKLKQQAIADRVGKTLVDGIAAWAPNYAGKKVIVDFSSPNVAKEMHVGHLRSTIIGDTISRTLEFCGADVLRLNHIGDWGTQFGMLCQYLEETRPEGMGDEGDEEAIGDLMAFYRAAKQKFDQDEAFKTRSREAVTKLQGGDPAFLKAWQRICEVSRKEFSKLYVRLGVTLTERGESFYNPMLANTVEELQTKGVAQPSDGAMCVFVEGKEAPLIVQKTDGGYGYASTDCAAIRHRVQSEKADWIIYVTDSGQAMHFEMVFDAARRAGWLPPPDSSSPPKVTHVGFGLVLGEDGKKFKTRSGDVVRLVELLDEAKQKCADSIRERREESKEAITPEELDHAACAMGYGAVKYADLKNNRTTDYKFSFDAMLSLKGNTAVYLLYAHARIAGIIRKTGKDASEVAKTAKVELGDPRELDLALHICRFPEAIEEMLVDLMPNRITDYLYDLSEKFNSFYQECKVVGSEQEASRLLLCEATAVVMRQCFHLLGITPLYRI